DVENSVQNLAHINRALAAAVLGRRDHRLDNRPFGASQITRITKTAAVRSNAMFRLPHRALSPPPNQAPTTQSEPIHWTQQLPGSALRPSVRLAHAFANCDMPLSSYRKPATAVLGCPMCVPV